MMTWLRSIWHDGHFAARSLRGRPWEFMAVVSMLGLAIGIATAMFTILDALIRECELGGEMRVLHRPDNPRGDPV